MVGLYWLSQGFSFCVSWLGLLWLHIFRGRKQMAGMKRVIDEVIWRYKIGQSVVEIQKYLARLGLNQSREEILDIIRADKRRTYEFSS